MLGHVHPDGDVLGTLLALGLALEAAGLARDLRRAASGARARSASCPGADR